MNLYPKEIQAYLETHTKKRDDILQRLDRQTYLEMLMPQMITGHLQGNLISILIKLSGAKKVLEIGTFTGYASICMARSVPDTGIVHTIEKNREFERIALRFWNEAKVTDKIEQFFGNALEVIKDLNEVYDFIYIDASKRDYSNFYQLVLPKLKVGGFILADNVLWSGKVVYEPNDNISEKLDEFNKMVTNDPKVENVILPLRDGIHLIRKITD